MWDTAWHSTLPSYASPRKDNTFFIPVMRISFLALSQYQSWPFFLPLQEISPLSSSSSRAWPSVISSSDVASFNNKLYVVLFANDWLIVPIVSLCRSFQSDVNYRNRLIFSFVSFQEATVVCVAHRPNRRTGTYCFYFPIKVSLQLEKGQNNLDTQCLLQMWFVSLYTYSLYSPPRDSYRFVSTLTVSCVQAILEVFQ